MEVWADFVEAYNLQEVILVLMWFQCDLTSF